MKCPTCSSKTILIGAWKGSRHTLHGKPNVLAQYRCRYGHYFATVRVFDGVVYQEHYTSSEQLKLIDRSSVN